MVGLPLLPPLASEEEDDEDADDCGPFLEEAEPARWPWPWPWPWPLEAGPTRLWWWPLLPPLPLPLLR